MTERVLVPIDGSPLSRRALEFALEAHPDAAIAAIHVIDPVEAVIAAEEAGPEAAEEWYDAARERGDRIVEGAREVAAERGVDLETIVGIGNPSREILEYADEHGIDHVVMGSHGRTGLSRVVLGSVAERVMRRSSVPVTVVR